MAFTSQGVPVHERITEVNTGAPLPADRNAVIMIEHTQQTDEGIVITASVPPWKHVRMLGEDIVATELVIPANHKVRPVDIGAIAGCGVHQVEVRRQPHVVIIPTGSELVTADSEPQPGQIIEYNSLVLGAQIEQSGGHVTTFDITPDDRDSLENALQEALDHAPDLVLMLSGSSGREQRFYPCSDSRGGTCTRSWDCCTSRTPCDYGHGERCACDRRTWLSGECGTDRRAIH
ncbi:MAG: molybdopterin-binding protein [Chloroflexota bacterium]